MAAQNNGQINFDEWYESLTKNNILLMFKGDFDQELIKSIVSLIEGMPEIKIEKPIVKSRMTSAIIECLQNICRHGESCGNETGLKPGIILVRKGKDEYIVAIGNPILTKSVEKLMVYLDKVNKMDNEELKKFHKEVLINSELFGTHGADIGLIDIAMKSHRKFEYDFKKLDEDYTFFSFELSISTIHV